MSDRPHSGDAGTPRPILFYDCSPDREQLVATSIDEAVENWGDAYEGDLPETVTVHAFAAMELPSAKNIAEMVEEHVLMWLDEELSDPDGRYEQAEHAAITAAALRFAAEAAYICQASRRRRAFYGSPRP
ncbi:MAG TPA: hypothetical protein VGQ44_17100 [Gemmatimonadaceae bacterium]|jgi:hypothetical protein|nr:hypothetical protein [Gemmatimonadaceae bacterium]